MYWEGLHKAEKARKANIRRERLRKDEEKKEKKRLHRKSELEKVPNFLLNAQNKSKALYSSTLRATNPDGSEASNT